MLWHLTVTQEAPAAISLSFSEGSASNVSVSMTLLLNSIAIKVSGTGQEHPYGGYEQNRGSLAIPEGPTVMGHSYQLKQD